MFGPSGCSRSVSLSVRDICGPSPFLFPKVSVDMPPHVLFARHKMDVHATESHERWLERVASAQLAKHGGSSVSAEQDKFFAGRLALIFKIKDQSAMMAALRVVFNMNAE